MREIKFRAWNKHLGKMKEEICINEYGEVIHFDYGEYAGVTDDIVMQYTGLTDKNGKEIYEGDVYHTGDPNITYTVVWHDTGLIGKQNGASSYVGLSHWQRRIEVIGNRFEHPHLLEESK